MCLILGKVLATLNFGVIYLPLYSLLRLLGPSYFCGRITTPDRGEIVYHHAVFTSRRQHTLLLLLRLINQHDLFVLSWVSFPARLHTIVALSETWLLLYRNQLPALNGHWNEWDLGDLRKVDLVDFCWRVLLFFNLQEVCISYFIIYLQGKRYRLLFCQDLWLLSACCRGKLLLALRRLTSALSWRCLSF